MSEMKKGTSMTRRPAGGPTGGPGSHHTYKDNGDTYSGYGLYVDDLVKCDDDRWRIKTLRLTYRVLEGQLRQM